MFTIKASLMLHNKGTNRTKKKKKGEKGEQGLILGIQVLAELSAAEENSLFEFFYMIFARLSLGYTTV